MTIIMEEMIFFVFLLSMEYSSSDGPSSDSYRIIQLPVPALHRTFVSWMT